MNGPRRDANENFAVSEPVDVQATHAVGWLRLFSTKGLCQMPTHQQNQNRNHDNNQKNQAQNQNQNQANQGQGRDDMRQANQRNQEQDQDRTRKDAPRRDDSDNR